MIRRTKVRARGTRTLTRLSRLSCAHVRRQANHPTPLPHCNTHTPLLLHANTPFLRARAATGQPPMGGAAQWSWAGDALDLNAH